MGGVDPLGWGGRWVLVWEIMARGSLSESLDRTDIDPLARTPQETEAWYAEVARFWSEANPSVAAMGSAVLAVPPKLRQCLNTH